MSRPEPTPRTSAALAAARRGWHVFRLRRLAKQPRTPRWQREATRDLDVILRWWSETPTANVGIACEPSRLVVVAMDMAAGKQRPAAWSGRDITHGRDVLRMLAERAGEPDPVETYTVTTPRRGEQRFFTAPPGVRLDAGHGDPFWLLDVHGVGGYVVAAGSQLRRGGNLLTYRVTNQAPVAPLPDWLCDVLTSPPSSGERRTSS